MFTFSLFFDADEVQEAKEQMEREQKEAAGSITMDDGEAGAGEGGESSASIVSVCQRVKAPVQQQQLSNSSNNNSNGNSNGDLNTTTPSLEEIWALIEFEEYNPDMPESTLPPKRYRKWKRFDTESELSDFIRRDTGEPLTLPPYSLAPDQSARIQEKAKQEVSQITEEFRRFRVRAELARKQADAHIKELQSSHVQTAQRRIEGQDLVRCHCHCLGRCRKSCMIVEKMPWKMTMKVKERSTLMVITTTHSVLYFRTSS